MISPNPIANARVRPVFFVAIVLAAAVALAFTAASVFAQATPEVSIAAAGDVTEGDAATFTVTASPAPLASITVPITVSEGPKSAMMTADGAIGAKSVVIPAGQSTATLTVATDNDQTDEPRSAVMAVLDTPTGNAGYTVSAHAGYATVMVADNDVAVHKRGSGHGIELAMYVDDAKVWRQGGKTTLRFTLNRALNDGESIRLPFQIQNSGLLGLNIDMTNLQGTGVRQTRYGNNSEIVMSSGAQKATFDIYGRGSGDDRDITIAFGHGSLNRPEATGILGGLRLVSEPVTFTVTRDKPVPPATTVTMSNASGGRITEGTDIFFTVSASPAPTSPITVNIGLTTVGDFGFTGPASVTLTQAAKNYYVRTVDDSQDEVHGSVTATIRPGSDYSIGSPSSRVVTVYDDDEPGAGNPVVTISPGPAITEGQTASFTITANPAPTATDPITVAVDASEVGRFIDYRCKNG